MNYETLQIHYEQTTCIVRIHRPDANNTINERLIEEFHHLLDQVYTWITILVIEGSPNFFCFGADFMEIFDRLQTNSHQGQNPESLYNLWMRLATGPFVTVTLVRGKTNAGGVGFVAASDIVLADLSAQFSLSEMLFGLYPACVMPFLIRRIGFQRAHYMTLLIQTVNVEQAHLWGLVDAFGADGNQLLRKHLTRLRRLNKKSVTEYKEYMNTINHFLRNTKKPAIEANQAMFKDESNLKAIYNYVEKGLFPWEKQ